MEADLKNIETSIVTTTEKNKVVTQEVAVTKPKIEETETEKEEKKLPQNRLLKKTIQPIITSKDCNMF